MAEEKVMAPMYGEIIDIKVKEGDTVEEGDTIVLMESMKMEVPVAAGKSGVVKEIKVEEDQKVESESVIAIIE